ncbi:ABC transporter ATP-binding protein [Streptomyces sp. NBC_00932]|uniref:ABC transporter ATP-binding protein n=1 Tax=Streptomyces sp. NBC_00932 TaxID=2903690 RepID=UPI003864FE3F|nr:ABC transporter ATP-binding protein [Streptomyces sp. NBC_00932]
MTGAVHPESTGAVDLAQRRHDLLLEVKDLTVEYVRPAPDPGVVACRELTFHLRRGEILGVAGESGSGKSTLITALTRLQRMPAVTTNGSILLHREGSDPLDLVVQPERVLRRLRWSEIAIVMQSAMDALNPVMRLGAQFADVLRAHDPTMGRKAAWERAAELVALVGISADRLRAYPHELSGGMRQRASIALALACEPSLIVMDEPTTAVDVVMQRQILSQVLRMRERLDFAVVFVTHDLSLLLELADRIAIMYAGRIVEEGPAKALYADPQHPYTRGLRDSFPPLFAPKRQLTGIPGVPPSLLSPPAGCAFHPRCDRAFAPCDTRTPELVPAGDRQVACHLHTSDALPVAERAEQSAPHEELNR